MSPIAYTRPSAESGTDAVPPPSGRDAFGLQSLSLTPPDHSDILPPPSALGSRSEPSASTAQLAAIDCETLRAAHFKLKARAAELEEELADAVTDRERRRLRAEITATKGRARSLWGLGERLRGYDSEPLHSRHAALAAAVAKLDRDAERAPSDPLRLRLREAADYARFGRPDPRDPQYAEDFGAAMPPLLTAAILSSGLIDPDDVRHLAPLANLDDRLHDLRDLRASVAREAAGLLEAESDNTD